MSTLALSMVRGEDATFAITITDGTGHAVNLTGGSLAFEARYQPTDAIPVITATPTITTPSAGQATLTVPRSATVALVAPIMLGWAITLTDLAGKTSVPLTGSLLLALDGAQATAPAYCSALEVYQRMSGDQPTMSGAFNGAITDAILEVSDLINGEVRNARGQPEGWSFLAGAPVTRRYTGARGGAGLLLIDDAIAVASVVLLDAHGTVLRTLVAGQDWRPYPPNSLPIVGLRQTQGTWPWSYPDGVQITLTPGYGTSVPTNVRLATINEVIRAYRAGQAGMDDRLGMTPYGTLVVSKALLSSTLRTTDRYRFTAGLMRGAS